MYWVSEVFAKFGKEQTKIHAKSRKNSFQTENPVPKCYLHFDNSNN